MPVLVPFGLIKLHPLGWINVRYRYIRGGTLVFADMVFVGEEPRHRKYCLDDKI